MPSTELYFTTSTIWICPDGITQISLVGAGGGGGAGGNGGDLVGGGGGAGSIQLSQQIETIPNATYIITIGAGGANNKPGGNTIFSLQPTPYPNPIIVLAKYPADSSPT